MKLFGGKKEDRLNGNVGNQDEAGYFDSPVETVSLERPAAPPTQRGQASAAGTVAAHEEPPTHVDYGINNAIQLMRALPVDQNVELVVQVIKTTLESLKVKVSDIIADAARKQKDLEGRVANLKSEIDAFEKEIAQRKAEIASLEADHSETTNVKARLELAEKAQQRASHKPIPAPAPPSR
jgi:hypothetical protein